MHQPYTSDTMPLRRSKAGIPPRQRLLAFFMPMKTNYVAFLLASLFAIAANAQNQTYDVFLSKGGSGAKTGTDWQNAADAEAFMNGIAGTSYTKFTHNIYIMAGSYLYSYSNAMKIGDGVLIQGGFPTSATGTDLSGYNPIANHTDIKFAVTSAYFLRAVDGSYTVKGLRINALGVYSLIDLASATLFGPFNFTDTEIYNYSQNYAAIYLGNQFYTATANITNCYFHDNTSALTGSAISAIGGNTVNIKNSSFSNNSCTKIWYGSNGNAADQGGAITAGGDLTIDNSSFCGNSVPSGGGGAIGNKYSGTGGGPESRMTITNSVFSNNSCMLGGGAIGTDAGAAPGGTTNFLKLTNTHFYGNKSGVNIPLNMGHVYGGGAVETLSDNSTITGCNFYGNSSANTNTGPFGTNGGGAIGIFAGTHTITNSKFEQNTSALPGGAIFFSNYGASSSLTLNGSTLKNNKYNGSTNVSGSDLSLFDYFATGKGALNVNNTSYVQLTGPSDYKTISGGASTSYHFDGTTVWGNTGTGITVTSASCPTSINPVVVLVPDLTPIIYARPSAVHGTKAITVVVDVLELKGVATSGLITVRVSKDPHISLSLTAGASLIGGRSVQNSLWSFDGSSDPVYYVLSSTQPVAASGQLSFGLEGSLNPSATNGNVIISSVVDPNSGGETRVNNNADADRIDYFQL